MINSTIWLHTEFTDFRKQIDGLVMLVADHLKLDPTSGQLFLFRNKTSNKLKILWWDKDGFWLFYKRLEQGRLIFPKIQNEPIELTRDQMVWLLSGLDFTKPPTPSGTKPTNFY